MVVLETFTFLKGRQDNKRCSLKKFEFSNRTNKVGRKEYNFITMTTESGCDFWTKALMVNKDLASCFDEVIDSMSVQM